MASMLPYVGVEEVKDFVNCGKSLIAEFVGTLFLVLVGCGSCLANPDGDFVRIALAFGVTVATLAQSVGHVSGCHINPAVTAGLLLGRKIGLVKAILYVVVQCIGAIVGAGLLQGLTSEGIGGRPGLGITAVNPMLSAGQALGIEFLITFVLVTVVFAAAADDDNAPNVGGSAPLAIGLSITTCHLFAIPLTGSSMNPARSFGPAVITGQFEDHWVYWIGPLLGGVVASLVYQLVFKAPPLHAGRPDGQVMEVKRAESAADP